MEGILPLLSFIAGFALAWFLLRSHRRDADAALRELSSDAAAKNTQVLAGVVAPVQASLERVDAKIQELEKARADTYTALRDLSAEAVTRNTQALAGVVAPVQASLEKVDAKIKSWKSLAVEPIPRCTNRCARFSNRNLSCAAKPAAW